MMLIHLSQLSISTLATLLFANQAATIPLHRRAQTWKMDPKSLNWTTSCLAPNPNASQTNATKAEAILTAFDGALELVADARDRMNSTHETLLVSGGPGVVAKGEVNRNDPAYVQFFKQDYSKEQLDKVSDVFGRMGGIFERLGKKGRPAGREGSVLIKCGNDGGCADGKVSAHTEKESDEAKSFSHTITFCDSFFGRPRFDQRKEWLRLSPQEYSARTSKGQIPPGGAASLKKLVDGYSGSDALIVVHELSHLSWIGETNTQPAEVTGWFSTARYAADQTNYNPDSYTKNADSYAWYAEYGWFQRALRSSQLTNMQGDPWPNNGPLAKPIDPLA